VAPPGLEAGAGALSHLHEPRKITLGENAESGLPHGFVAGLTAPLGRVEEEGSREHEELGSSVAEHRVRVQGKKPLKLSGAGSRTFGRTI